MMNVNVINGNHAFKNKQAIKDSKGPGLVVLPSGGPNARAQVTCLPPPVAGAPGRATTVPGSLLDLKAR